MAVPEDSEGTMFHRDSAMRKVWLTPEVREKLYPFLDLESMMRLAECHKLTRESLKKAFTWNKLIKRTFFEEIPNVTPAADFQFRFLAPPEGDERHERLAPEKFKARSLAHILSLIQDSPGSELEMDLIHAVCARLPRYDGESFFVTINCPCLQTHQVSPLGFVLLEEIQDELGSREKIVLKVEEVGSSLHGSLLAALSSMVTRQQGMEIRGVEWEGKAGMMAGWGLMICDSKESAAALANVARSVRVSPTQINLVISGGRKLGAEEWAAIRGAVEVLAAAPDGMKTINLESEREDMVGGAKEDLKAIWALAGSWLVEGDVAVDGGKIFIGSIFFCKEEDGERGGWEGVEGKRKGLEAVIDMTDEEFMREADIVHGTDEESGTEEEGEDPGIE